MKKRNLFLVLFFTGLFLLILMGNKGRTIKGVGKSLQRNITILTDQMEKPNSGHSQYKSFFDSKRNFKSQFQDGIPSEYLPNTKDYTSYYKLREESKWDYQKAVNAIREEKKIFRKYYDFQGQDEKAYQELANLHKETLNNIWNQTQQIEKQFEKEIYGPDKGLR